MISLNSFLHRELFSSIIGRWLEDRPKPGDVRTIKELVNYNCYLSRFVLDDVITYLLQGTVGPPISSFQAPTKGALKDFLVNNPPYVNERIEKMLAHYRKFPQDYYRETPFDGRVYYKPGPDFALFLGSTRRKRFRRIAEKVSRRIIDMVFAQIKGEAENLAKERATKIGVPFNKLQTPIEKQVEEFEHAERRIIKRIRLGEFVEQMPTSDINDVFGVKVLCDDDHVHLLTSLIDKHPRFEIIEAELHSGSYNAVNITLRYSVDKQALLEKEPSPETLAVFAKRGISPEEFRRGFRSFLLEGEDDLIMEVIASDYQEVVESEVGRSMHEERVLGQRGQQQYRGSLARNIAWLVEYMLALRRVSDDHIEDVPIKLWIKYMPDYFEAIIKATYRVKETVYLL